MKDYKGRGSDLQFREPKARPVARLLAVVLGIAVLAAATFYGVSLLTRQGGSAAEESVPGTPAAIPLQLPAVPASREQGSTPAGAEDGGAQ